MNSLHSKPESPDWKQRRLLTRFLLLVLTFGGLSGSGAVTAQDKTAEKKTRFLYVPFEDLDILFDGSSQHVFLSQKEFEELLEKSRTKPKEKIPRDYIIVSANSLGQIRKELCVFDTTVTIESFQKGLQAIPLDIGMLSLQSAKLNGGPAPIGRNKNGQSVVFISGRRKHELKLQLVTRMQTDTAQQSTQFRLPIAPSSTLKLSVEGNVEMSAGPGVISRIYDQPTNQTLFELVPTRGNLTLAMSVNNKKLQEKKSILTKAVFIHELTSDYEQIHARVNVDIQFGSTDNVKFNVPDGFQVTDVSCQNMSQWGLEEVAGKTVLQINLRTPATKPFALNIAAINTSVDSSKWKLKKLSPIDVDGEVSVVGVVAEERFVLDSIHPKGLIQLDNGQIQSSIPVTVFQTSAGAPAIATVAAFYAPDSNFELAADFSRPPAKLKLMPTSVLFLSDQQQKLIGQFELIAEYEKIIDFDLMVPKNWRITSLVDGKGKAIEFQRFKSTDETRLNVKPPGGLQPGIPTNIVFEAISVPDEWSKQWNTIQIPFPNFRVMGSELKTGAIAVAVEDDLSVRAGESHDLETLTVEQQPLFGLDEFKTSIAFETLSEQFSLSLNVDRLQPQITATTYSFFQFQKKQLAIQYEVAFDIQAARTRKLQFALPKSTPDELRVRGLGGCEVTQTASTESDDQRLWTVELSEPKLGEVRLAIDFFQPLVEEEPEDYPLPIVEASGVLYQLALAAFEGNLDYDIDLKTSMRSIDVGEMGDAHYAPGSRLLGAYSSMGNTPDIRIDVTRRDIHQLPAVIVESTLLKTLIARNGKAQTEARYRLASAIPFVEIELPENAELWAAELDGLATRPRVRNGQVLISIPPDGNRQLRTLKIFYENQISRFGLSGKVSIPAPKLFIPAAEGFVAQEVPQANLEWSLVLPGGYTIASNDGTVFTENREERRLPFEAVTSGLFSFLERGLGAKDGASEVAESESRGLGLRGGVHLDDTSEGDSFDPKESSVLKDMENKTRSESNRPAKKESVKKPAEGKIDEKKSLEMQLWALKGRKGVEISNSVLESRSDSRTFEFRSLGQNPSVSITIVDQERFHWFAFAYGGVLLAFGLIACRFSVRSKLLYLMLILVIAATVPLLGEWTQVVWSALEYSLYVAMLLVPIFILHAVLSKTIGWIRKCLIKPRATAAAAILLATFLFSRGLNGDDKKQPVQIPDDVIIVPYDPANPDQKSGQYFIPYNKYVELYNKANPSNPLEAKKKIADFAWCDATYRTSLANDKLLIRGKLTLETFDDTEISIPISLGAAVITKVELDGQPAKLKVLTNELAKKLATKNNQPIQQRVSKAPNAPASPAATGNVLMLYVAGKGQKQLEIELQVPVHQQGGWRMVQANIPVAPANQLTVDMDQTETELHYQCNQRSVKFESSGTEKQVQIPLDEFGCVNLRWRDQIASSQVDQNLSVNSTALFDVRDDGLHLQWKLDFLFQGNEREKFNLELPADFSVVQVLGKNVRGWQILGESSPRILEVTLLTKAVNQSSFEIALANRKMDLTSATSFPMPTVVVPDAAIHSGQITVRKTEKLELQTDTMIGISRIDISDARKLKLRSEPLFRPANFQAFEFSRTPFSVAIQCRPHATDFEIESRTILDVREKTCGLETQFLASTRRALHEIQIEVPVDLEIQNVNAPVDFRQSISRSGGKQLLTIFLAKGLKGQFTFDVSGRLPDHDESGEIKLPQFKIQGVSKHGGQIGILAEKQLNIATRSLVNCEDEMISRVQGWLNQPNRNRARMALRFTAEGYDGLIKVSKKPAVVTVNIISNINVTLRSIEESVILDYEIRDAGIEELSFLVPRGLRNARIKADLVRQKTIEPVNGDEETAEQFRIKFRLQDSVIGQYRILLEQDRGLTSAEQVAFLPQAENTSSSRRYVTLQNSGFDELLVNSADGMENLDRRQTSFRELTSLIGGADIRRAYLAGSQDTAELKYQTNPRKLVETVGASIGLSEIRMSIDRSGGYRVEQVFYCDNRTEPFLEIRLPEKARVWTVKVAGTPVKPISIADKPDHLRIPLIKTADGDTDFQIVIKYGGSIGKLDSFSSRKFPFTQTVNIDVQSSNVRLYLPEEYDYYFGSDSTLGVSEEEKVVRAVQSYKDSVYTRLSSQATHSKNELVKQRALRNLKQFGIDQEKYQSLNDEAMTAPQVDNRDSFNGLFEQQRLKISGNKGYSNNAYGGNFTVNNNGTAQVINPQWFGSNSLANPEVDKLNNTNRRFNSPAFNQRGGFQPQLNPTLKRGGENAPGNGFGGGIVGGKAGAGSGPANRSKTVKPGYYQQDPSRRNPQLQQGLADNFRKQITQNLGTLNEQSKLAQRARNKKDAILESYRSQLDNNNDMPARINEEKAIIDPTGRTAGQPLGPDQLSSPGQTSVSGVQGERKPGTSNQVRGYVATSLDINFEHQGREYIFQAPSGDLNLSVTPVSKSIKKRGINFFVLFGLCAVLGVVCWFVGPGKRN